MSVPDEILVAALDALDGGEAPETILTRYAAYAEELRPFLAVVAQLEQAVPSPSPAVKAASKATFLNRAAQLAAPHPVSPRWLRRPAALIGMAAALILVISSFLFTQSAAALPGDTLYGVKLWSESVRLDLASDSRAEMLREQFAATRRQEVETLLVQDRMHGVTFVGEVAQMAPALWQVSGIPVEIDAQTDVSGTVTVGARVEVRGFTAETVVHATAVRLLDDGADEPLMTPEATAVPTLTPLSTVQPTRTPAPTTAATATQTLEPTAAASATPAATATATPTLEPTAVATVMSTATAVPPATVAGNDNDDDDDNGNDNNAPPPPSNEDDNSNDDDDDNDNDDGDSGDDENGNGGSDNDNGNDNSDDEDDNAGSGGGGSDNDGGGDDDDDDDDDD